MTVSEKLQKWYEKNGRDLPWRVKGRRHPDAYQVWISEIMLQQTTVKTVIPYFTRFLERFPDIFSLAAAPVQDVLLMWQGLGYYTRARKLHECAKVVVREYDGKFPTARDKLAKLPGVGSYTSASISAFAFNKHEAVVDGNVIRILTRLNGWESPVSEILNVINACAAALTAEAVCPADYASAIMDLGAGICTPKSPSCMICPLNQDCIALKKGLTDKIPLIVKLKKEIRKGNVFWIQNAKGEVFLRRRTEKGLLSGLTELPWNTDGAFPFDADWIDTQKHVRHVFTHFDLTLNLFTLTAETVPLTGGFVAPADFRDYPFSTLMRKVIKKAL